MSSIVGTSDYSMLSVVVANGANVHQKLDTLTEQASSGLISDTYAGLGTTASVSLDLRPQMANLQNWQTNIGVATGSMTLVQSTLSTIQSIASNFYAELNDVNNINGSNVDTVAASARNALEQVASALDAQDGDVYVFSGQDSGNAPVPGPSNILTSGFYTQIHAAVGNLGVVGAPVTAAATLAIASSNAPGTSPFSTYLSQPAAMLQPEIPVIQVGQGQVQQVGMLASTNSRVASTGSSTTGSYMRDMLRALATIGSLSSTQLNIPDFQDLVQDTRTSLSGAIAAMAGDAGALGNTQSSLIATQTQLSSTSTALTSQVSSAEDADMASTLSQISLVQTQLQASYQLIATLSSLSLAKFLGPAG